MKKRMLPYGYGMRNGNIVENADEAQVVRALFNAYAKGASYKELAMRMEGSGTPYSPDDAGWNKNKIARILSCEQYTGTEQYPAIITRELYEQVQARKPACGTTSEAARRIKAVRELSRCALCGGTICMSSGRSGWTRWNCDSCGGIGPAAESERIMDNLAVVCQALRNGAYPIQAPDRSDPVDEELKEAEIRFGALLDTDDFDDAAATSAALKLASMRYGSIGSEDYETERIRYLLEQEPEAHREDVALIKSIASRLLIHPDGAVSIRLKNGQMIGGRRDE